MLCHPMLCHPMLCHRLLIACLLVLAGAAAPHLARADEADAEFRASVRGAVERGLQIIETAATNYPQHRQCFSCHHQTMPLLAIQATRQAGHFGRAAVVDEQLAFTRKSFAARLTDLRAGKGIGGQAITVSYGLWTYGIVAAEADETSTAMVDYLLATQTADGSWGFQTERPPMESSRVTSTALAAYGLLRYAAAEQREKSQATLEKARAWLDKAPLVTHEDRVFALWGSGALGRSADHPASVAARQSIERSQREDGGWAQLDSMQSDAYATGQALWALREAGLAPTAPPYRRGLEWLLAAQQADGSWKVESRSRPIQRMFDNGDPHGKHQFISTPATCWAVAALAPAGQ